MGCPILLGYAEKVQEVSKTWSSVVALPDVSFLPHMRRHARSVRPLFKDGLERRAKVALRLLVQKVLKQALERSQMREETSWLDDIPADLDYQATRAVLRRLKDRATAWHVNNGMLEDGKAKTEGLLALVFIERVWQVTAIADSLIHDMAQDNFTSAGSALAHAMSAAAVVDANDWLEAFELLKEAE